MTERQRQDRDALIEHLVQECYIDPKERIEHPPVAISLGEHTYKTRDGIVTYPTPIGTYGNFSFIQAPPKHKKTFLVSLLSAAYLGGKSKRFVGGLKGHRNDKCLYHFDTEQGRFHAQKVFRRVLDMCELEDECYSTFGLRAQSHDERLDIIEYVLKHNGDIGVLVIDGVADLVSDVNNIEESNMVVGKIMKWTEMYQVHIITVIHTNHGSNKPTGHLGSALEKKAETQIQLEKDEENPDIINVRCKASRSKSFDDFSFFVNDYGYPEVAGQNLEVLDYIGNAHTLRNTA
jgi:hypothetical protein